jgi:hypothetical protein
MIARKEERVPSYKHLASFPIARNTKQKPTRPRKTEEYVEREDIGTDRSKKKRKAKQSKV